MVKRVNSSASSESRPAPDCSRRESAVISPARAALPARSGWLRSRSNCRSGSASRTAVAKAAIIASRLAKGRALAAACATQAACSAMSPKQRTKRSGAMALISAKVLGIGSAVLLEPEAKRAALFGSHAGVIAKRHGVRVHRLFHDEIGVPLKIVERFQHGPLWRLGKGLMRRLSRM